MKTVHNDELMHAAILGYKWQQNLLQEKIDELAGHLNGNSQASEPAAPAKGKKRRLSAETRAKMVAAQQARWSAKRQKPAGKPKRKMSEAGRKAIADGQLRRWRLAKKNKALGAVA